MILYPILLNLESATCCIVGGGEVARRKVKHLLEAGAQVRVIAPKPARQIAAWARKGQIELIKRRYTPELIDPATRLVFACTDDPGTNRQAADDARALGIQSNIADDPARSDFHLPSMVRRDDLLLTVSTGGKAPALAREICHRLEQQFGPAWGEFTSLLGDLRARWRRRGQSAQTHVRMLELIGSDTFEVMQSEGRKAGERHAAKLIRKLERRPPRTQAAKRKKGA